MSDPAPTDAESPVVVVMKFGGTSIADTDGRKAIAQHVVSAIEGGRAPVVVVSAMGRAGAPYATDTLLDLVDQLPADARERDLLASCGEVIAAVVLAHELRAAGVNARACTGADAGIATDGAHGSGQVTEVYPDRLVAALDRGETPIVCGFQGIGPDGSVTTLGRGGSDTTACVLGVALNAEAVEIYTDVDGVMTADPRACENATVLETIGPDELFQMAKHGSRVVHVRAAELALASGLAMRIRGTFTDHAGTLVADIASYRPQSVATAVSAVDGVARVRVSLGAEEGTSAHMDAQTRVYRAMADAGVSLDMFTSVGDALVFSVDETSLQATCVVLDNLQMRYATCTSVAKVTLVGAGMHGVPGVMARVAEYLSNAGVVVLQTADSHTTISVLVRSDDADTAVAVLHDGFGLAGGALHASAPG